MQQPSKNGTDLVGFHPSASSSSAFSSVSSSSAFSSASSSSATFVPPSLPFWLLSSFASVAAGLPSSASSAFHPPLQYPLLNNSNQWALPSAATATIPSLASGRTTLVNALNGANGSVVGPPFVPPLTSFPSSSSSSSCASSFPSVSFSSANLSASNNEFVDRIGESARNRFGRPYISGRPLLLCDRQKIIKMYREGRRKIAIAREIGVTHSCVSKVIRRFEETGMLESKNSRTASCACPGDAEGHDPRICRHARFVHFSASSSSTQLPSYEMNKIAPNRRQIIQSDLPKKFSIEWILSEHCAP